MMARAGRPREVTDQELEDALRTWGTASGASEHLPVRWRSSDRPLDLVGVLVYLSPTAAEWFPAYLEHRTWRSRAWVERVGLEANGALEAQLQKIRGEASWRAPLQAVEGFEDPAAVPAKIRRKFSDAEIAGAFRVGGSLQAAADRSGLRFSTLQARMGGLQLQKVGAYLSSDIAEIFDTSDLGYDEAVARMLLVDRRLCENSPPWL